MNESSKYTNVKKVSDEEILRRVELGHSRRKIARDLGMGASVVTRRVNELTRRGMSPKHDWTHAVPEGYMVKGTSSYYGEDGKLVGQWVKSTQDQEAMKVALDAAMAALGEELPRIKPRKVGKQKYDDMLTAYPIGDPHFGMYAHKDEAGDDWDLDIAKVTHMETMQHLVSEASPTKQAIIVNLGDALHYDGIVPITNRSKNILDSDGRAWKMINVAVASLKGMVEIALTKHKSVHLVNVKGNHDEFSAAWLSSLFANLYEKEPRVTVETSPAVHTYYRFGKTLIGMHHGHTSKADRLPGVMATDRAKDWGECLHRYWWTGHIHTDTLKEYPGVVVESFGTLAAKDEYAASSGYRSRRSMKRILIDKERGEIARAIVTL